MNPKKKGGKGNAKGKPTPSKGSGRGQAKGGGGSKKVSKGSSFADSGANLGSQVGGMLGRMGAGLISRITGFGSYEVSKNTISNGNAVASFYNDGDGVVVCHREYLKDISGSSAFDLTSYAVNPGLPGSFPWLSSVATQFEEYEMLGLVYEFRPLSGMAVSTTSASLGCVIYATDYNPYNPSFPNKQAMESYEFSTSTVPFNQMLHPVECRPGSDVLRKKFVRSGGVPAGTLQLYDVGNFQFASQGMQSAYVVGELWVSYHVKLSKPRLDLTPISGSARLCTSSVTGATSLNPQGTAWVTSFSTLPGVIVAPYVGGATTALNRGFYIQAPGLYQVVVTAKANNLTITGPVTFVLGSNIVSGPLVFTLMGSGSGPNSYLVSQDNTFASSILVLYVQVVTAGLGSENFIALAAPTGLSSGFVSAIITALPFTFTNSAL